VSASESPPVDYQQLTEALVADDLVTSAAEVHGALTGLLCTPQLPPDWQRIVLGEIPLTGSALPALIERLCEWTEAQLRSEEFSFEPLLPPEESPLSDRVEALAGWCRGFLDGLLAAGVRDAGALPGEGGEFIHDLLSIGEAEPPQAPTEEEERAYAELVEYLRAGVGHVYEECRRTVKASP